MTYNQASLKGFVKDNFEKCCQILTSLHLTLVKNDYLFLTGMLEHTIVGINLFFVGQRLKNPTNV